MGVSVAGLDLADFAELGRRQAAIDRLMSTEGAGHIVHDLPLRADGRSLSMASRPWRLDPIPFEVSAADFTWLEAAVKHRMHACESLLVDLYGDRRVVSDGLVDPALLWGSDRYRLAAVGSAARRRQRRWLSAYAVDVVCDVDGVWWAVAEYTDAPAGLGYAVLARRVMTQVTGDVANIPRPLEGTLDVMRRALVDATTVDGPRIAVLSGGIDHQDYVEHSYLATMLGFNLVEGPDLVVRDRHLWLQTLGGLEHVDVLYRRLSDRYLDPMETNSTGGAGVPGVLLAAESGNLAMANAHGTGVLEDPLLSSSWDAAAEMLVGEAPWLRLLWDSTGWGSLESRLARPPARYDVYLNGIVQQVPVVLRLHVLATDDGLTVVPGSHGRVVFPSDDPRFPTPCLAKDVWVGGDHRAVPIPVPKLLPQVDFITSVPTRAADSLYWLCRAGERAEAVSRSSRVVLTEQAQENDGRQTSVAVQLLAALCGPDQTSGGDATTNTTQRRAALSAASESLRFHIGSMLVESASVREFLSATTGRVLFELAMGRDRIATGELDTDSLDALLLGLSAFAGLWNESVVRGPAWYFGDFARRYERSVVALIGAASAVRCALDPERADVDRRRGLESVLAANDSLVAYRRRHRSDVEIDAVLTLLLHDARNPRSAAAALAGLERNASAIGWEPGAVEIAKIQATLNDVEQSSTVRPYVFDGIIQRLHAVAAELATTKLAAPPHPMRIHSIVDPGALA